MLITLLTDFGTQDTFVGVLKGVIHRISPDVTTVDLTHHVPPQDIAAGAFALGVSHAYFPPGTVHLAIVDPGVGTSRRPVAAHIGECVYVCPDNGLLSHVLAQETLHEAVTLDNAQYHLSSVSRTFHGRDIFAPVAAHLAAGVPLANLGTPLDSLMTFPLSRPDVLPEHTVSHIVYIDVFGNVFLDVTKDILDTWEEFQIDIPGQRVDGPVDSYSAVSDGQPLVLFGSSGYLEIAVRNGNAARQFRLRVGDTLLLCRKNSPSNGTSG